MDERILKLLEMAMAEDQIRDSITIGTPSKGGEVKIYLNFSKPDECTKMIDTAMDMRAYANTKWEEMQNGKAN